MSPIYKRKRLEALEIIVESKDVQILENLWQSYKDTNARYSKEIDSLEDARENAEMEIFDQIIERNKQLSN